MSEQETKKEAKKEMYKESQQKGAQQKETQKETQKEIQKETKQDVKRGNPRNAQNKPDTNGKTVTKYDLKVQRREAEKARAKRDRLVGNIVSVVIVAVLFCLVASFPIRNYLAVNETYARINGENVSRLEFDYNYNLAINNYLNEYGSYMAMLGMDLSGDLSTQMYSDTLTFQDFFTRTAVENISNNKALQAEAQAAGFIYDTAADYADYEQRLRSAASEAGMTVKDFVRDNYGRFATLSRISGFVKESMYISKYYDSVMDSKMPSDEEAESYYNDNRDDYDSVDYRLLTVEAQLSEAPTEEETAAAMARAEKEAEAALARVATEGDLNENMAAAYVPYLLKDWLFDSVRKPGDTTVIENTYANSYYVVSFADRYLDSAPTVNIRTILTPEGNAQAIYDEWAAGEATEESFAELCDRYNDPSLIAAAGGLLENVRPIRMTEDMAAWLSDSARRAGDTTVLSPGDDEYSYVMYFVGQSDPWWLVSARNELLGAAMEAYMEEITADISVEDPRGNLKYLYVSDDAAEGGADSDGQEGSGTEGGAGADAGSDAAGSPAAQ